jgi:nucleoside-diphosphate-sugar epimerase
MKILLTGGAGDLGCVLSRDLERRGDLPIRLDVRRPHDSRGVFIEGSILDRAALEESLVGVEGVVHIAAWHGIHEVRGWKTPPEFWELNVTGTFNVFEAAVQAGVDKVVYISSTSVSDRQGIYGFTKRLGEEIARDYARRHRLNVISLRPRAFIPYWNKKTYANYVEWAQWFWKGAVHLDDVGQAVLKSIDLLAVTHLPAPLELTVDGAYEYSDEDLREWDKDGAGTTFKKHYARYYDLALRYGLDPTLKPSRYDMTDTRKQLGYEPRYSLKNLLEELSRYGEAGPPTRG